MPPEIESEEWTTVTTLWTVAGWVKAAVVVVEFIYEFGKTSPIEYALERIERELADIRGRLDELEDRVDELTLRLVAEENRNRVRHVNQQAKDLRDLVFQLRNAPADRVRAAEAANSAGNIADLFLEDEDLWNWSDIVKKQPRDQWGEPVGDPQILPSEPDFKLAVAYPVYSLAIVTWLAGILVHTAGDKVLVQQQYGDKLDRHIQAVSLRYEWRDDGTAEHEPVTVAERIRARITCQPIPFRKYAENGRCTYSVQCSNVIERTNTAIRDFVVDVEETGSSVLCMISPTVVIQDEQLLEDEYPAIVGLNRLEEMMRSVRSTGHLPAEPFIGRFPTSTPTMVEIYGVRPDETLHRYKQIFTDTVGPMEGPEVLGGSWPYATMVSGGGRRILALGALRRWVVHTTPEAPVQNVGWAMEPAFSGGRGIEDIRIPPEWVYFGDGYGVIYGRVVASPNDEFSIGDLYWVREQVNGSFSGIRKVGWGWNMFTQVFSVGDGVIYGVYPNGELRWQRHAGWQEGDFNWEGPRDMSTGVDWNKFEKIIPAGVGFLYGMHANGQLVGYRHLDWKTGGNRFEGPFDGGIGWRQYRTIFAAMPAPVGGVN